MQPDPALAGLGILGVPGPQATLPCERHDPLGPRSLSAALGHAQRCSGAAGGGVQGIQRREAQWIQKLQTKWFQETQIQGEGQLRITGSQFSEVC